MQKNKQTEVDEMDRRILRELRVNCRRSYRQLGKDIGLSPAAIIDRIERLQKNGVVLAYCASLNLVKVGYEFMGIVHINIESGHIMETQEKISKLKGVYAMYDVTGEYDSIALIMCKNRSELSTLIKKISSIPNVKKTNTNIVLNVVKDPFQFNEV